jgi:hypothetical protein
MMRLPDLTIHNALVTPLLVVRVPLMLLGMALEKIGRGLQELGALVPAWTNYQRRRT